jgi:integrase
VETRVRIPLGLQRKAGRKTGFFHSQPSKQHRGQADVKLSKDGLVFWRPAAVPRRFRTFRDAAGMDNVPLYSLRHQAATKMIDAGVDAKTASDRLGNSVANQQTKTLPLRRPLRLLARQITSVETGASASSLRVTGR